MKEEYYIQGDPTRAEEIKAAFEKLGYEKVNVIHIGDYANERLFFFTENGKVRSTLKDCGIVHIIKTHPGYKELELPVKPNFKVGDWITDGACKVKITDINNTNYWYSKNCILGEIESIDKKYHLWTIADAKDGDVLVDKYGNVGIYEMRNRLWWYSHIYFGCDGHLHGFEAGGCHIQKGTKPATSEQCDILFAKMRESGYEWDEKKKELRKIQPHYDITNFQPFDKVLVRQNDSSTWGISFFGCYSGMFMCCSNVWYEQCIPFDGNDKLLGTTDPCDERYINW